MCNFGTRYQEEQVCEIILNLDQWFKRFRFNDILSGALVALLFGAAEPFVQFLKKSIMGNIHVKLYEIWTSGLGDVVSRKS